VSKVRRLILDIVSKQISEALFNYLGCNSNPYLRAATCGKTGKKIFYWHGPPGQMYRVDRLALPKKIGEI